MTLTNHHLTNFVFLVSSRMPRSAASIQLEITNIENHLSSADSLASSVGADGVNLSRARRDELTKRLDQLYQQLDIANGNARRFTRGFITGL